MKRKIAGLLAVCLLAGTAVPALNMTYAAQTDAQTVAADNVNTLANGYYTIGNDGVVVDMQDVRYEDGVQAVSWYFGDQNNQLFLFEKLDSGYKITAVHSKKVLTMQADGSVVQSRWTDAANQKWNVIQDVQGNFYLQNLQNNAAMSVTTAGVSCGNYTQSANQKLTLEQKSSTLPISAIAAVEDGVYQIQSVATKQVIGSENGATADGTAIVPETASNASSQKWRLENRKDGQVYLTSVKAEKLLDLDLANNLCYQWVDGYNLNQRWNIEAVEGGFYIKNAATGTALELAGAQLTASAAAGKDTQKWGFVATTVKEEINTLADGYYTIGNNGVVVDMQDVRYEDGVQAVSWYFGDQNNQLFLFEKLDSGYKITAVHSKKVLTMQADGSVVQSRWTDAANQKWNVIQDVQGNFYLQNLQNNAAMSVTTAGVSCGNYTQSANQKLTLEQKSSTLPISAIAAVEDGVYQIQSVANGQNLTVENNSWSNGAAILTAAAQDINNQKWHLENRKDGRTIITGVSSRKTLDLDLASGTYVQWKDANTDNQRWYLENHSGNYWIRNHANGTAIAANDSKVASAAFDANAQNQQWTLLPTTISNTPIAPDMEITSSLGNAFAMCQTTVLSVESNIGDGNFDYEFSLNFRGRHVLLQHYGNGNSYRWTPIEPGIYTLSVAVKLNGQTYETVTETVEVVSNGQTVLSGIDVSFWQSYIDWKAVKNSGIQYAMLRVGYGRESNQKDTRFEEFYTNALANDIPVGVYHYSYADSVADAVVEAKNCLSMLNGRPLTLPVAYDIEDASQSWMSKQMLTDVAIAFCEEIRAAGYQPMIYCNTNFSKNRLDMARLREKGYDIWIASYGVSDYGHPYPVKMWQYTSDGSVAGINGRVDMNYWYVGAEHDGDAALPEGQKGYCNADTVNVRNSPNYGTILYTANTGYTFTVLEKSGVWYRVTFGGGRYGWIHQDYVTLM